MGVSAKVVADSLTRAGDRLVTMEIELHRIVLPEFNTHRVFSRNFQSSRAVPVKKMIEQVRTNPAMPVYWGKNQSGMVAVGELIGADKIDCEDEWLSAARRAAHSAERMMEKGCHKQITNRLLEPFMWTRGVVTASLEGYKSFFKLRCHSDAQPEIKALADAMRDALEASEPAIVTEGDYHLPYVNTEKIGRYTHYYTGEGEGKVYFTKREAIKVSTSCCAQISYRALDDSVDKALRIYDMLNLPEGGEYKEDPPHFSPTEHVALCVDEEDYRDAWASGNFSSFIWWQYRKALEVGREEGFIRRGKG